MQENPYAAPTVEPSPTTQFGGAQARPRDWTISHVLGVGWRAVKAQPVPLVGGMFLVTVVQWVVQGVLQLLVVGDALEEGDLARFFGGMGIMFPVLTVLATYLMVGQLRVALAAARGKPVEIATYFSGYDKLLPGILLGLMVYLGVLVGMLFLIIPGLLLALGWALAFFQLVDTDATPMEAISASWEQTKGERGKIFLFGLASAGIALLGLLAFYVGLFVAMPLILVASAEMYLCISGRS